MLMLLSDKICFIIDIAIIALFISDSTLLAAINLASPFIYFSAVIYTLFGVGGSLLALIESIDVTIIQVDEKITITLTYEGELINPITEETIEHIEEIDGDIEYNPILGFNRAYINIPI